MVVITQEIKVCGKIKCWRWIAVAHFQHVFPGVATGKENGFAAAIRKIARIAGTNSQRSVYGSMGAGGGWRVGGDDPSRVCHRVLVRSVERQGARRHPKYQ